MTLDLQFKLKSNPLYLKYLHESSNWYKILNREPKVFNAFLEEMKMKYQIRPQDRIDKISSTLEMINMLFGMNR